MSNLRYVCRLLTPYNIKLLWIFFLKNVTHKKNLSFWIFQPLKKLKTHIQFILESFIKFFHFIFWLVLFLNFFFRELREGMCQQIMLAAVLGRKNPSLAFIPVVEALSRRLLSIRGLYQNPDSTQCTRHQWKTQWNFRLNLILFVISLWSRVAFLFLLLQ